VRHDLTGVVRWVRHFGGSGAEGNVYDSVDDDEGTTYASGAFGDSLQLDAFRLDADMSAVGAELKDARGTCFLFALDADGGVRWAEALRGDAPSGGNEIALSPTETSCRSASSAARRAAASPSLAPRSPSRAASSTPSCAR
jgi:hypothetical protein